MSDLETLMREYADVAAAGYKTHWANALRSAADELTALRSDIERHVQAAADLANEVAELRAENERLREDADLYRWLRERVRARTGLVFTVAKVTEWSLEPWSGDQLDKSINAARKDSNG